ncbi:L-xylulose reductase [Fusarium oxysporum f. sp. albedinis]|nr:L-xylulose reductase [Fusarium oxysporum f. sp. albedinis]
MDPPFVISSDRKPNIPIPSYPIPRLLSSPITDAYPITIETCHTHHHREILEIYRRRISAGIFSLVIQNVTWHIVS